MVSYHFVLDHIETLNNIPTIVIKWNYAKLYQTTSNYINLYQRVQIQMKLSIYLGHICFIHHAWSDYAFTKKATTINPIFTSPFFHCVKEKATDHLLQKVDAEDSIISDDDQRGVKQEVDFPKFYFFVVGFFN